MVKMRCLLTLLVFFSLVLTGGLGWAQQCSEDTQMARLQIYGGSVPAGAPAAFAGNVLNETFDAAGYDSVSWTESGVMDEDDTTTPPIGETGFSGQCLEFNAMWNDRASTWNNGTDYPIVYIRFRVYVHTEAMSDGGSASLAYFYQAGDALTSARVNLIQTSGQLYLQFIDVIKDPDGVTTFAISEDTSYEIEIKLDDTNDDIEFRVNGSSIYTNTDVNVGQFSSFFLGFGGGPFATCIIMFDDVDIDTGGYPTD